MRHRTGVLIGLMLAATVTVGGGHLATAAPARPAAAEAATGTRYAWELYRYDVPWKDRNILAQDHDQPYARELMHRLRMWEDCAPAQCRAATR